MSRQTKTRGAMARLGTKALLVAAHFVLINLISVTTQIETTCTVERCQILMTAAPCANVDEKCYNSTLARIIPSLGECNCCEHCLFYKELHEDCLNGIPGQSLPDTICSPGLKCRNNECIKMIDINDDPETFPRYIHDSNNPSRCQCVAPETDFLGSYIPIFGSFECDPTKPMDEVQCGCSVLSYKVNRQVNKQLPYNTNLPQPTLRCLPNGQFDPLQCVGSMCGCVDKETGTWNNSIQVIPADALHENNPYCFNVSLGHRRGYYTECELLRNQVLSYINYMYDDQYTALFATQLGCTLDGVGEVTPFSH